MAPDETELFWGWSVPIALGMITMRSERCTEAEVLLTGAWERARAHGSRYALIWASTFLTELEWRRGRLRAAFRYSDGGLIVRVAHVGVAVVDQVDRVDRGHGGHLLPFLRDAGQR